MAWCGRRSCLEIVQYGCGCSGESSRGSAVGWCIARQCQVAKHCSSRHAARRRPCKACPAFCCCTRCCSQLVCHSHVVTCTLLAFGHCTLSRCVARPQWQVPAGCTPSWSKWGLWIVKSIRNVLIPHALLIHCDAFNRRARSSNRSPQDRVSLGFPFNAVTV